MIQYIYFVKCPNCDDEPFDFFKDAKEYALGCLSAKPVITQIEVDRNDFGECTDSRDLGTVWSWEEMMNDVSTDEPETSVFTKDDLVTYDAETDSEFSTLDNSLDAIPDNFRKPIPDNMTIDQLVEEMEENEDDVECKWCGELYDKSECRYEVDMGWLCDYCIAAIKSRGETLTFREGLIPSEVFTDCVKSSNFEIWGIDPIDEFNCKAVLLKHFENVDCTGHNESQKIIDEMYNINGLFVFSFDKNGFPVLNSWNVDLLRELPPCNIIFEDIRYDEAVNKVFASKVKALDESASKDYSWDQNPVELEYTNLDVTLQGVEKQSTDPYEPPYCDEWNETVSHTYEADPITVAEFLWDVMTEEDVASVPGGFETLEDDAAFNSFMEERFDDLVEKYMDVILKKFEDDAVRDYEDKYDPYEAEANAEADYWDSRRDDYFDESCATKQKTDSMLEELEDSETYRERLSLCPECGANSFDIETGICINCGFN